MQLGKDCLDRFCCCVHNCNQAMLGISLLMWWEVSRLEHSWPGLLAGWLGISTVGWDSQRLPFSQAIVLNSTVPIMASIMARVFLHDKLKVADIASLACCFFGVLFFFREALATEGYFVKAKEASNAHANTGHHIFAILLGLFSSIMGGTSYCLIRAGAKASDQPISSLVLWLSSPFQKVGLLLVYCTAPCRRKGILLWEGGMLQLQCLGEEGKWTEGQKVGLRAVLQAHYLVFRERESLPPLCDIKHHYRKKFESWKLDLIERKIIKVRRDLETGGGRTKNNKTEENYTAHESFNFYEADTHWTSWLVPMFGVANIVFSVICVYINNCLKNNFGPHGGCVTKFLGRLTVFSFGLFASPAMGICTYIFEDFVLPGFQSILLMLVSSIMGFFAEVLLARGLQLERTSKVANVQYLEAGLRQLCSLALTRLAPSFDRLVGVSLIVISVCWTMYIGPDKETE
ncbi:hypothetical protein V8G54_033841 [Vigna mungo]|uniref:EamA domain-containing protein n=1 Tax=Vigna mungo TaxID=3915 RepID=A0AAQ3RJC8_VIGMU